ncbi:MAG: VWA domain-containing protein, partial [Anaerolineales bacterium]
APFVVWLGWPRRGPGRMRDVASLALRMGIFLALVLGLAGLEVVRAADALAVVFVVDASDSVPANAQREAAAWVQQAMEGMRPDDQAAVVLFGGEALVERPMRPSRELAAFTSVPSSINTDLAEAIRLALALFPPDAARRMVILSDGVETVGDASAAARLAAASGVEIVVRPFAFRRDREILVSDVHAPPHMRAGEEFELEVTIVSTREATAGLRVFAGDTLVYEDVVALVVGSNPFLIPLQSGDPGFMAYRVQLDPAASDDTFYQNNQLAAFSDVQGPPRVLMVGAPSEDIADPTTYLSAALAASAIGLDVVAPSGLPADLSRLAEYASVMLVNVPARDLSRRQQAAIEQYVSDLGGGLVAVGGSQSYGVGGWFRTPIETALPVEMQLRDEERRSRLTMVFIIDKSGSMSSGAYGASKIELAKEAAIRSILLLSPGDRVGVIAFDDNASWVVPITELDDAGPILNRISTLRSGGGTDILAGVQLMAQELPQDEGQLKHVILLTDGGASPFGIPELVQKLYEGSGITFTTIGVGSDAADFLPDLARVGGGRYHFTEDPSTIPEIFTEETTLATRAYIIEEDFFPVQTAISPILEGIADVPVLHGYVGTTAKQTATTILMSELAEGDMDPILASWQHGLGRSVAWTSDATARWAERWVTWDGFARMWAQATRFTIGDAFQSDLTPSVTFGGETAVLTVDALDLNGAYLNDLPLQASVVAPDGEASLVDLVQVAPGRYEAEFEPAVEGAYLIRVSGTEDGRGLAGQTTGWVFSYSPEYRTLTADPNALVRLAALTGGGVAGADPTDAFARAPDVQRTSRPIWPQLLLAAALLLPLDIAVRRLVFSRYDIQRAWAHVVNAWSPGRKQDDPVQRERMSRLQAAKRRAGTVQTDEGEAPPTRVTDPPMSPIPVEEKPAPATEESEKEVETIATRGSTPTETASTLLARRRARRKAAQDKDGED